MGSKSYRKSDLLRLWQARSVSKLFYDCVLETFAQKHVKWTTVILELGQFETEIDSNDEADPRSVPDTSAEACWEIDESHSESEEEYIFGDRVTGRLTLEYEFHGWVEEGLYPTGFSPDRKTHAIFRPKDGVLPYDAELCRERIWKLAENKSVYPHTGVIMWNIAHDLRLPELYLWSEDGKIMFDWRKFLRGFFALEREVCRVRTIKVRGFPHDYERAVLFKLTIYSFIDGSPLVRLPFALSTGYSSSLRLISTSPGSLRQTTSAAHTIGDCT